MNIYFPQYLLNDILEGYDSACYHGRVTVGTPLIYSSNSDHTLQKPEGTIKNERHWQH